MPQEPNKGEGTPMSIMVTEVYQALVDAGASEEKARAAAEAIPDMSDLAEKNDVAQFRSELKQDIAGLRSELKQDVVGLKADLYKQMWLMQGATILAIVGLLKLLP
jgi:hypothetical protein